MSKKTALILAILLLKSTLCVFAQTKAEVKYLHRYDWGDEREQYVTRTYVDNLCYFYGGYGNRFWLLVRTKGSSLSDGIYAEFDHPFYPPLSSVSGAWLGGYGVEGGPCETKIIDNQKSEMSKGELRKLNTQFVNMFLDEYLHYDEKYAVSRLAAFSEIINFLNKNQLRLLRNAIYASHGYSFKAEDLKEVFSFCSWYKINPNFSEDDFTEKECVYLKLIKLSEQLAK